MFDVFYSGTKPNLFAHEREALDIDHAKTLSCTRYFWWVNYLTDYTGFDFYGSQYHGKPINDTHGLVNGKKIRVHI
jgi:hypothetical protein